MLATTGPVRRSGDSRPPARAPRLGQDTESVLSEFLGSGHA
jgi:crotonobetainyl-CoA:carnitine CoA-transferase CaiB-like acyl-CoA transferase